MSTTAEIRPASAHAFAKAALVLALWITLGVLLAMALPKSGEFLPVIAGAPTLQVSTSPSNPI